MGGATRLGDINPEEEPYKSNLAHEKILVLDVTHLEGDPHTRAFDDVDSVMVMIEMPSSLALALIWSNSILSTCWGRRTLHMDGKIN
jgi:hypothetical protein